MENVQESTDTIIILLAGKEPEQLPKQKITPIAKDHNLKTVYLIGSYARGEATADSDIDLLFDGEGSDITSLVKASSLYADIKELFDIPVDLVSMTALQNPRT